MELCFLGTSSATPTRERNVSSCAVRFSSGEVWLVDCGEGTQHRLSDSTVKLSSVRRILVTHLHGDHCYGLPGLLCSLHMHDLQSPVEVIGPVGLRELLETTFRLTGASFSFPLTIREVAGAGSLGDVSGIRLEAWPLAHLTPSWGYVLVAPPRRGRLDPRKAAAAGVPEGPLLAELASGREVVLDDGRTVRPADVLGAERAGVKVVILGDTSDPSAVADAARGCDVLVHEATYDRTEEAAALSRGHSTAQMAGRFAARVGARTLVLTHFSTRYTSGTATTSVEDLVREAHAECPTTRVLAARDLWTLEVATVP